jgi:hypothetical protein
VPTEQAAAWLEFLLAQKHHAPVDRLCAMQLARCTGDRYRDLPPSLRERTAAWLQEQGAAPHLVGLVREGGRLDDQEQQQVFGESLPKGLRLEL